MWVLVIIVHRKEYDSITFAAMNSIHISKPSTFIAHHCSHYILYDAILSISNEVRGKIEIKSHINKLFKLKYFFQESFPHEASF